MKNILDKYTDADVDLLRVARDTRDEFLHWIENDYSNCTKERVREMFTELDAVVSRHTINRLEKRNGQHT